MPAAAHQSREGRSIDSLIIVSRETIIRIRRNATQSVITGSGLGDQGRVEKYMTDFNECIVKIGTKDGLVYKWPIKPCMTIEMKVEELYDQTPKIGAGSKITG